jgi:hypothetical protein
MIVQRIRLLTYADGHRSRMVREWPDFTPPKAETHPTRWGRTPVLPERLGFERSAHCFLNFSLLANLL